MTNVTMQELEKKFESVRFGGSWKPVDCISQSKMAIIIPYRNREIHLNVFLNNMIPFLQYQRRQFTFFIIEQAQPTLFNRAALLNIGFKEAIKLDDYDCFINHDVDLLPLHLCNVYKCSRQPRHLSGGYNKFNYTLLYDEFFGGVTAVDKQATVAANGYTNIMFGWGGEDDNMYARFLEKGFTPVRYEPHLFCYDMILHEEDESNPRSNRSWEESYDVSYMMYDGLNSINYTTKDITQHPLYTRILVELPGPVAGMDVYEYYAKKRDEYLARKAKADESKNVQSQDKEEDAVKAPNNTSKKKDKQEKNKNKDKKKDNKKKNKEKNGE